MSDFSEDNLSSGSHGSELLDSKPDGDVTDGESDTSSGSNSGSSDDSEDAIPVPVSKRRRPDVKAIGC